ncbi:hypothetical protein HMPREF1624_05814 [Sporothrix schenckii ATCC 58251]|uniref:Acyltransferase MbtK/IucB-like conserved domain-containing protein n=1 Tax=Sporothrix schenckii (strain ATCC 58251 / de Perez 2211183) TaxID=1391915 RepID=U7PPS3_SPOS1|nr:hypothetical protein HMPREF1624_05814 [Sporothrix schenckii ATCC 58251]
MVNSTVYLPDGQHFTVVPVFAGLLFKSNELNPHHSPYPVGWTIVLHTDDGDEGGTPSGSAGAHGRGVHAFSRPTLQGDSLFLSSVNQPSSAEFKPAASPTRLAAMMLWVSLYWYFQQPAPDVLLPPTAHSSGTPLDGRPRGEWRIRVKRDGMLRVRNLIPKLERMGLIVTLESSVVCGSATNGSGGGGPGGSDTPRATFGDDDGWDHMYVTRSMFWQIPPQLFLFSLQPVKPHDHHRGLSGGNLSSFPGSPMASRPSSPGSPELGDARKATPQTLGIGEAAELADSLSLSTVATNTAVPVAAPYAVTSLPGSQSATPTPPMLASVQSFPMGPFYSTSHLPTYYPPSPLRYTMTGNVRHPARPRPPRMGEVFYNRYIPSVQQFLSLRVASLSPHPVPYYGPRASPGTGASSAPPADRAALLATLSDDALLQTWMAVPRVHKFWGDYSPTFLRTALASRHSFPVIGLWDGVPFGYFELYWVKEDTLGLLIGAQADDFDRGLHVFVGEEWARGRVALWLTSVVQWLFTSDYRCMSVCMEPRVDNERFIAHLQAAGFNKQREITFRHKQSWFGRLHRDGWEGPAL